MEEAKCLVFFLADAPALRTHCRNRILEISYEGVHVHFAVSNSIYLSLYLFWRISVEFAPASWHASVLLSSSFCFLFVFFFFTSAGWAAKKASLSMQFTVGCGETDSSGPGVDVGPWTTEVGALCRGYVARRHVTYVKGSGPPPGITMCRCPRLHLKANPRNEALGLSRPFGC